MAYLELTNFYFLNIDRDVGKGVSDFCSGLSYILEQKKGNFCDFIVIF